jgi:hypothetical protein
MTTKDFTETHGIRAKVKRIDRNPNMDGMPKGSFHYSVTLQRGELGVDFAEMRVPFSCGPAITDEPTAHAVLDCLASDASGIDSAGNFEDWAREYGYDTDSRKAERVYAAVMRQTKALRAFMGKDYYALVFETERS